MVKYVNDFTRECDSYLIYENEYIYTYLLEYDADGKYVFRTAGGTRGYVIVDDNSIVTDIKFYGDDVYSSSIVDIFGKYIGQVMLFEEVINK